MARVLVLGSSNTDLTLDLPALPRPGETVLGGPFRAGPGGKGANQAVAARRAGADVIFLTAVGDDAYGRDALDGYRREGIDVSHARIAPGVASGVALILVGPDGENMIGVAPGANAHLTPDAIDRLPDDLFAPGAVFLASLEVPLETVAQGVRRASAAGMIVVLNPAPCDLRLVGDGARILEFVDVLTPNHEEATRLCGLFMDGPGEARAATWDLIGTFGARSAIVTRGREGCLVATRDAEHHVAAFPVRAVDTVGAGDAFNGALAVALAEGRPLLDAASWASAAAALAVTRPGAQAGLPVRAEIDRLAAEAPPPRPFDLYYAEWSPERTPP